MTAAHIIFEAPSKAHSPPKTLLVGRKADLLRCHSLLPADGKALFTALVESVSAGVDGGLASSLVLPGGQPHTFVAAVLPEACSRHCSPLRNHAVTKLVAAGVGSTENSQVLVILAEPSHAGGVACAIARAFPRYSVKAARPSQTVRVGFATIGGRYDSGCSDPAVYAVCSAAADGVRLAQRLVDTPPAEMTTTAFVGEARHAAERLAARGRKVSVSVITGTALRDQGYGGLWGVGKAAEEPPALCVLSYLPEGVKPARTVALVGKGIVYDTGGLALKPTTGMCGMKADCGGAAALLGAFEAAVAIGTRGTALHCLLCLAENAIGPAAVRNDDIIRSLSGKTIEINNSDAEGRLVLADGVAHATALPPRLPGLGAGAQPDLILDMATLTGAQLVATGKRHGAVVSSSGELEAAAVAAGLISGDVVHPLPFAPEWFMKEFQSAVADMKNSVKDRQNGGSSCAASFIHAHLHPRFAGGWLHADIAGPAFIEDRGTGFGVGLTLALLGIEGFDARRSRL